jgi:hypothetical protein
VRDMNKQNNEWVKQTVEELRIWGCNELADIEQLTGAGYENGPKVGFVACRNYLLESGFLKG